MDIGTVARETGLPRDTLRIWERRYGFPTPVRLASGERTYPREQLARLHAIRQLLNRGMRPGLLLRLPEGELAALLQGTQGTAARPSNSPAMNELRALLQQRQVSIAHSRLAALLLRLGLQRFITDIAAPLTEEIGELWAAGKITIADEHRYTELLQQLIRGAIRADQVATHPPRVLLTTLPGELHGMGLVMAQAWLTAEGIECIALGTQVPAADVVAAAREYQADVVGLSFSQAHSARAARTALAAVRSMLDPSIALWAGGSIWLYARKKIRGVDYIVDFEDLATALKRWN
jgi:DNA-binding transcriptional MerR regulator